MLNAATEMNQRNSMMEQNLMDTERHDYLGSSPETSGRYRESPLQLFEDPIKSGPTTACQADKFTQSILASQSTEKSAQ